MKKLIKPIITLAVAVMMLFSFAACAWDEVDGGSRVQRVKIELEFLDASGAVNDTQSVEAKLYLDYAPKTCEHFLKLVADGYYDNTVISNVGDAWCEFGAYNLDESNSLIKKAYDGATLDGEFEKNGWTGNPLRTTSGALIMKREYNTNDGKSQYNTAKSTVAILLSATTHFNYAEYCVFGNIVSDDATSDSTDTSTSSRDGLSSLAKVQTLSKLAADEDGNKTYYCEEDGKYYSLIYDAEDVLHYYEGTEANIEKEIKDEGENEALTELKDRISDKANTFLTVPYTAVRIKTISKI